MALKDWKKDTSKSWKNHVTGTIINYGFRNFIQLLKNEPKYEVVISRYGKLIEENNFGTETQAIAYAKNYMRSH